MLENDGKTEVGHMKPTPPHDTRAQVPICPYSAELADLDELAGVS